MPLVTLEVVGELVVLSLLLLLQIVRFKAFVLGAGKTRQLLLRLRYPNARLLTSVRHALNSYFLAVSVLVMFDRQLGLASVDLVALLTHALGRDVIALLLFFFLVTVDL